MGLRVLQRHFEIRLGLLPLDRWKSSEKPIKRLPRFEVVDQRLYRNASACKDKLST